MTPPHCCLHLPCIMDLHQFHFPTLLLTLVLLSLVMGSVLLCAWRFNRHAPGLREFALASLSAGLASLTVALRSHFSELFTVVAASFFVTGTAWLVYQGCRLHAGRKRAPALAAAGLIGTAMALAAYFTAVNPVPGVRFVATSLVIGPLFLLSAHSISQGGRERYPSRYLFALLCSLHGVFILLRPWLRILTGDIGEFGATMQLQALFTLESTLFMVLLSIGALMLANEFIADQLTTLAEIDPLTGMFNRRAFMTMLNKAHSQSVRTATPLSVMVIDVDHFKRINDTWGHQTGDQVLRQFAQSVSSRLRHQDVAGRMGGEEFAIYLPHVGLTDACEIAQRLRLDVAAQPAWADEQAISYTMSIGVAELVTGETTQSALQRADQAMYQAKKLGRNQVCKASSPLPPAVQSH